mmetsp:Transcript_44980/g.106677  ORF Transcript_44980/g.106677 Transcript_44980/m.106677 type:complete len:276 (+) Transcript_44980:984-1811(+)
MLHPSSSTPHISWTPAKRNVDTPMNKVPATAHTSRAYPVVPGAQRRSRERKVATGRPASQAGLLASLRNIICVTTSKRAQITAWIAKQTPIMVGLISCLTNMRARTQKGMRRICTMASAQRNQRWESKISSAVRSSSFPRAARSMTKRIAPPANGGIVRRTRERINLSTPGVSVFIVQEVRKPETRKNRGTVWNAPWSTVYSMIRVLSFQFEGCWLTFVGKPPNWSLVVHQQCPHTTFHTLCDRHQSIQYNRLLFPTSFSEAPLLSRCDMSCSAF